MSTLSEYLTQRGESARAFADRAQVSQSLVSATCQGATVRDGAAALKIERATKGEVTVADLATPRQTPFTAWLAAESKHGRVPPSEILDRLHAIKDAPGRQTLQRMARGMLLKNTARAAAVAAFCGLEIADLLEPGAS